MNFSKERLKLKHKLEGKVEESPTGKSAPKRVSRLVIPQMFLSVNCRNDDEQTKSLNSTFSKSTGNLATVRKISTSFKLNDKGTESVTYRGQAERKLSSKSFSHHFESPENIVYEKTKRTSQAIINIPSTLTINNPVVVGSIPKDKPDISPTFNFIRTPKTPKEEGSSVLHFNFVNTPEAKVKQNVDQDLPKTPTLSRAVSIPSPIAQNEDKLQKEESQNIEDRKDFDKKEDEIYVNVDTIRLYQNCARAILWGPINKKPLPSIRFSLMRQSSIS